MGPRAGQEILEKKIISYPCWAKHIIVQPTGWSHTGYDPEAPSNEFIVIYQYKWLYS
jgi:hypothetical protein